MVYMPSCNCALLRNATVVNSRLVLPEVDQPLGFLACRRKRYNSRSPFDWKPELDKGVELCYMVMFAGLVFAILATTWRGHKELQILLQSRT